MPGAIRAKTMFLVRIAFWVTVVALLLPTPDNADHPSGLAGSPISAAFRDETPAEQLNLNEVAGAAMASAEDVLTFCDRNPTTCETGLTIASHVQNQVLHYGGLAVSWLATQSTSSNSGNTLENTQVQHPRERPSKAPSPSVEVFRGA